ncbi:MAG: MHYT domain-containing protein [Kiloniellales bacterium]|nr:MHYT domain-containing protein [Kiloniellales bacterium]
MFSEFFLTEQHAQFYDVEQSYTFWLVLVSYAIAAFAAFVSFYIVERVVAAPTSAVRLRWLVTGGAAMGAGIWSMHFSGMMALEMPAWLCGNANGDIHYDPFLTVFSAVFAMLASGFAFYFVSKRSKSIGLLLVAGTILGAGIGLMHYSGMAAMRMYAIIRYDPVWFSVSILAAVILASYALWQMSYTLEARRQERSNNRGVAALIMGLAITLMHYAGMAATHFLAASGQPAEAPLEGVALNGTLVGVSITGAAVLILGMALFAANKEAQRQSQPIPAPQVS